MLWPLAYRRGSNPKQSETYLDCIAQLLDIRVLLSSGSLNVLCKLFGCLNLLGSTPAKLYTIILCLVTYSGIKANDTHKTNDTITVICT